MPEKRKETRVPQKLLIRFDGDDFSIYSKTKDISATGAFISTHYMLSPGSEIRLTLDDARIEKKARVIRVVEAPADADLDSTGFAVEFLA